MHSNEKLNQLKEMLESNLIKKRKTGVELAAQMLVNNLNREEVRSLLENVAKNDVMITVQEKAQHALDEDDERLNPRSRPAADYIFGATCPKGHVSHYDKREYCPKSSNVIRRVIERNTHQVDEILVKCKSCTEEFYVEVPCEGYK